MNKKEFVVLCLRLLGIYIIVTGISSLPNAFSVFFDGSFSHGYLIVSPLIYIISGIVLYTYAPKLRSYVINFSESENDEFKITIHEKTARIACIILGLYIFAYAVPEIIQLSIEAGAFYHRMSDISQSAKWYEHRWLHILPSVVELIIAAVLIIGSDKVIEFISKFDDTFKKLDASNKANSGDS
ncbi:MAG: hypothetical protein PVJ19_17790 [Desulfobacteraceae bacterium]|jgi:hypothetical protein